MWLAYVASINDIAAIDQPGYDDQLVDSGSVGILLQGLGELRAGVAAQHHRGAYVAGVAAGACDVFRVVAESVVVLADGDGRWIADVSDRVQPCALQRVDDRREQCLDRVIALGRVSQIAQGESALELDRAEIFGGSHERVS